VQQLLEELRARLVKMKEDNSFGDIDTLIRNLTQYQKSVLVEVENLKKLYMNWTSATAKVGLLFKSHVPCQTVFECLFKIFVLLNRYTEYLI
jgi:hypothetical protein